MAEPRDIPARRSTHPKMVCSRRIIVMSMIDDWDLGRHLKAITHVPNVKASDFIDYLRSNAVNFIVDAIVRPNLGSKMLSLPGLSAMRYHPSPRPGFQRVQYGLRALRGHG